LTIFIQAIVPTHGNDHSWLRHIDGLEQIFALYGAASTKSNPLTSALLEITRPMMIVAALYARRPSLIATPEWSATASWISNEDHSSTHRLVLAKLSDSLAQIPELYHVHDVLSLRHAENLASQSIGDSEAEGRAASTAETALLGRTLDLWFDIFAQNTSWTASDPHFEVPSASSTAPASARPYPCEGKIHFPSLQAANIFTFYNAIVILISQLIISIVLLIPNIDACIMAQAAAALERISTAITQIIKSIDFHLTFPILSDSPDRLLETPEAGASESRLFYLLLPIRIAHRVLSQSQTPQDVAKKLWLEDSLCIIKDSAGTWMSNDNIFGAGKPQKNRVRR
jgi:hypothetical protein